MAGRSAATGTTENVTINIYDAYDPDTTARKIKGFFDARDRRLGAFA